MRKSLTKDVAEAVLAAGQATVDDLLPRFRGRSRAQLQKALQNGSDAGLIRLAVRGIGGHGKPNPGIWVGPMERVISIRPPASAWELGQGLQIAGTWPPEGDGRRYAPLGPWVEEATNDNDRSAA